jgi:hypothetical protein
LIIIIELFNFQDSYQSYPTTTNTKQPVVITPSLINAPFQKIDEVLKDVCICYQYKSRI